MIYINTIMSIVFIILIMEFNGEIHYSGIKYISIYLYTLSFYPLDMQPNTINPIIIIFIIYLDGLFFKCYIKFKKSGYKNLLSCIF